MSNLERYRVKFRFYWGHYHYNVNWSSEDQVYIGGVVEFPSLRAHGSTLITAYDEIAKVTQFVIDDLRDKGEPIPTPEGWQGGVEGGNKPQERGGADRA